MRTRQTSICVAALLLLHLQTACTVYEAAPSRWSIAPGSDVRVRFPSSTSVVIGYPEEDSIRHAEIPRSRAVEGRFVSTVGDTMRLKPVSHLAAPRVPHSETFPSASFLLSDETRVAVRRVSPERTTLLLLGLGVATYAVVRSLGPQLDFSGLQM